MKITIESTDKIVEVAGGPGTAITPCRVWEGTTESGIRVQALIVRIAAQVGEDLSQFSRELAECRPPSEDFNAFPLRMIL